MKKLGDTYFQNFMDISEYPKLKLELKLVVEQFFRIKPQRICGLLRISELYDIITFHHEYR